MPMPTVANRIDGLVRKRPGINKEELRKALGTDVNKTRGSPLRKCVFSRVGLV